MRPQFCKQLYKNTQAFLVFCSLLLLSVGVSFGFEDPFQLSWDETTRSVSPGETITLDLIFQIPPGHYLYKDKMDVRLVEGEGLTLVKVDYSPSIVRLDPFFKKEAEIFALQALATASLKLSDTAPVGKHQVLLEVLYQGCSSKLCFRQQSRKIQIPFKVREVRAEGGAPIASPSEMNLNEWLQGSLQARGVLTYLLAFIGGVLTDFTPCVLPLIPLTLAVIGIRREKKARRNFLLTTVLVISMAGTYALLGVVAALLGLQLGFLFQSPLFLLFGAALFIIFSLALFGVFELQAPLWMRNSLAKLGGKGYGGAALSGMTLGILAAPCVGPIIGALLIWVAQTRDVIHGFGLLFVYGLGMGSLILLVGTFYGSLAGRIHGGITSLWIKRVLALLLLVPAAYYGYIAVAHLRSSDDISRLLQIDKFWHTDYDTAVEEAVATNKALLVDFYADWCFPCIEWERGTFSDSRVRAYIRENLVPLKIDCTKNTPTCKTMVDRYQVIGWPTVLVLDPSGEVLKGGRIVGEVYGPGKFLDYLRRILADITR